MKTNKDFVGFRLSPQQRLRWLAELPPPVLVLDINGSLDTVRLRSTLESLVARHESLRTELQPAPGLATPLQVIHDRDTAGQRVHFELNDGTPTSNNRDGQSGIIAQLIRYDTTRHRLRLELSPLSADRNTLLRLAQALVGGVDAKVESETDTTYSQYTAWLYELQTDENAEQGRQYWAQQGASDALHYEMAYREPRQGVNGESQLAVTTLRVDPALGRSLDAFCETGGYTPAEVLMAAWNILLQRLNVHHAGDSAPLPMAWIHDCREDYDELAPCWGLFSKVLPLSCQDPLDDSFSSALARLRQCQDDAREWQEYCAVDAGPQVAQSRFGFEWGGKLSTWNCAGLAQTGSLTVEITAVQVLTQAFELLLIPEFSTGIDAHAGYRLNLHYDPCSYTTQAITTLLEQYQSLLADALADPSRPLGALTLHSPSFNDQLQMLEAPQPVLDTQDLFPALFGRSAQQFPDHIALCDTVSTAETASTADLRRWTYRDLDVRSNQLAHHLLALGIGPESRVALYIERSADMVLAMLAVLKSGAAFLPLETQQPAGRTLAMLEAASPVLMLHKGTNVAPVPAGVTPVTIDDITGLDAYPTTAPDINIVSDNAAYLLFTSGSTGVPKGVVIEHGQLLNYVTSILARLSLKPAAKSALATSLAADLSYTLLFPALASGGELHVISRQTTMDPQRWAAYQSLHSIANLKIVPSLLEAWLGHGEPAAVLPQSQLIMGGEALNPALLNKIRTCAPALQIFNHYGPTETTVGVMMHKTDPAVDYHVVPLSDRLDHMRIYLLDSELKQVAPGQPGELYIAGPQLARGYLCPQQTDERFIQHTLSTASERLYRSGDLARYRPDGAIELIGRADRQVKIRGFRIELDEIEHLLARLPAVRQAAVVCVPRNGKELRMFAFFSLQPNQTTTIAQLQGQLQDRLPDYMQPTLRLVEALPLLPNGKLDRRSLSDQAAKILTHAGSTPPRTPLEALLASLWAEVLGLENVGVDDDFFALGGHSLAAVKLANRLQNALAAPVTVNAVFAAPTVARFGKLVRQDLKLPPLVDLAPGTSRQQDKPALFCFHPSTGHVQDYRILAGILVQWRLWGLQADYLSHVCRTTSAESIESLAAGYVAHLRQRQGKGPYYLLGWSLGGLIALHAAAQLEQTGGKIAFVGIVDSQRATAAPPESIEALLEAAADELDDASQMRLRNLSPRERDELASRLDEVERKDWILIFCRWAQQQGLQLHNDSWQHLEASLQHHAHTQHLIAGFTPPRLNCPLTVWWAGETLAAAGRIPVEWHALTGSNGTVDIIDTDHMTILKHPRWQQQLQEYLDFATRAASHNPHLDRQTESSVMIDEIM